MNYRGAIETARVLHSDLHSCPRTAESLAERTALYKTVKKKLDSLAAFAGESAGQEPEAVRATVRRLILDAEYHAGLSGEKTPGGLDQVARQYEALEAACGSLTEQKGERL